ncbi:hypothetical protein RF11_04345 [Thelohanellus kitauei]|uniref:Uncharacterized protein n=1 Tax=Thelohanellus kitauei TaxID=669202 RepID=A0A0C2JB52_THEKT|nr:hypothetical protein RF11_04345 [Thelohanellus kitauei]
MRGYKEWKRMQGQKSKVIVDEKIQNNRMKVYHVTIEQIKIPQLIRFFGIKENTETNQKNRLLVTMDHYQKFLAHMEHCLEWIDHISSLGINLNSDGVYTSTLYVGNVRAYDFDIYVKDGIHYIRINYKHKNFNSFVTIDLVSLKDIVKTIKMLEKRYQHLLTDDHGHIIRRDRWSNDSSSRCSDPSNRFFDTDVYHGSIN